MSLPNDPQEKPAPRDAVISSKAAGANSKQLILNLLTAGILVLVVCFGFSKTVFRGAPISRLYQLGQRDTLFARHYRPIREGYDASVYQYFVPCHHFLVQNLRKGIVPLWNPLVGCGEPFMADIETATFWPLRAALIWMEPIRSWNLLIVLNLVIFSLGTFLLSTMVALRRFAAMFAAIICAFCPFLIFHSELTGSSASWIPLVLASFVWAEKKGTLFSKALAGASCALMIVSGHPEPSFFGITAASLSYLLFKLLKTGSAKFQPASEGSETGGAGSQPDPKSDTSSTAITSQLKRAPRILLHGLLDIALIGIFAFAFSAPLLIPFAELLKSSDCYKLGLTGHRMGVPLNSILINLIHPAYDRCSPFLGILSVPLITAAVVGSFKSNHYLRSLSISALILVCAMSQLGPLDFIMNLPSFSWFVPKYCFSALLVILCVLTGFGLQELTDKINTNWKQVCLSIIGASILVLASLVAIKFAPSLLECIRQDEAFEKMSVLNNQWTKDLIILTAFCVFIVISRFFKYYRSALMVLGIAVCTALSMAPLSKRASPVNAGLEYDLVKPIPFLQAQGERIVTMGRHTFCPSSNFVYGINNIVPVNVYHPSGFLTYLISCGITPEGVNQFFDNDLTPEIDLSATKYVVTPSPVTSSQQALPQPAPIPSEEGAKWMSDPVLQLEAASLLVEPENRQILGRLRFKTNARKAKQIGVQALARDEKGNTIWFGDTERILYLFAKNDPDKIDSFDYKLKIPLPKYKGEMTVAIQVFDWEQMRFLPFADAQIETPGVLQIAQVDSNGRTSSNIIKTVETRSTTGSVFKLVDEAKNHIRVYENTKALPYCYLSNELETGAVLSGTLAQQLLAADRHFAPAKWSRPDSNSIRVEVDAPDSMYLIVAEFFEQHWKAEITQGQEQTTQEIVRANKYFQAVAVPKGKSVVNLKYDPTSFKIGLGIFAVGLVALVFLALKKTNR